MLKYGLQSVKAHFLKVYDGIQSARKLGDDPRKAVVLDTCFVGGSKSGKLDFIAANGILYVLTNTPGREINGCDPL
jgi:hypothetical protein